ncbi:protein-L-isoaspartate(D-aspartate) O-methyltransferase [Nitrospira defluvii]|nr:protein-L-isoaspartate(D-aspartate) O-methyltransferase [Nitrospira defluvii]
MARFEMARHRMVEEQLLPRGIEDERVLAVMREIPRHLFVEEALQEQAYGDHALPIGERQTISQPYIVALMTEGLALRGTEKVLEIGTGSGYQTAILSNLAESVCSIERVEAFIDRAGKTLDRLACQNVTLRLSDGSKGWEDEAPFDAILVAAAGPKIPEPLVDQLKVGGRMIIPVGTRSAQTLMRIVKGRHRVVETALTACLFVPLVGEKGWSNQAIK